MEATELDTTRVDVNKDRLDIFLMDLCKKNQMSVFIKFVKIVSVLFHGNAAVERSFSYNKQFLVENLEEDALVAQRVVHDYTLNLENLNNVNVSKNMMTEFKNSSKNRKIALKRKKKLEVKKSKTKKTQCKKSKN